MGCGSSKPGATHSGDRRVAPVDRRGRDDTPASQPTTTAAGASRNSSSIGSGHSPPQPSHTVLPKPAAVAAPAVSGAGGDTPAADDLSAAGSPVRPGAARKNSIEGAVPGSKTNNGDVSVAAALRSKRRAEIVSQSIDVRHDWRKPVVEKPREVRVMLATALKENVIFAQYSSDDLRDLINAMRPMDVEPGAVVIRQHEDGDNFYVIERGKMDILVDGVKVATFGDGTHNKTVGELALLFNSPRAATVTATTPARLWVIDRDTFRRVLAQTAQSQHDKIKSILRRGLLASLEDAQIEKIAAAATRIKFNKGDQIIRKGDIGEVFYIIETGSVVCTNIDGGQSDNRLHAGDYFGERALLKAAPRAADVFADTDVSLVALYRDDFESLLGQVRELLEHNLGMRLLLCVPFLGSLPQDARTTLFASLRLLEYKPGRFLVREGKPLSNFFIIKEGEVAIVSGITAANAVSDAFAADAAAAVAAKAKADQTLTPVGSFVLPAPGASLVTAVREADAAIAASIAAAGAAAAAASTSTSSSSSSAAAAATATGGLGAVSIHQVRSTASASRQQAAASSASASPAAEVPADGAKVSEFDSLSRLSAGQWFGEWELQSGGAPEASVVAKTTVQCFQLPADVFLRLLSPLPAMQAATRPIAKKQRLDGEAARARADLAGAIQGERERRRLDKSKERAREMLSIPFSELQQRRTLGTGTFGRVKLVYHAKSDRVFALKALQKSQIVALRQEANVIREKEILSVLDHPFIIKLYQTYKDAHRLYMLLELVQGGELFGRLQVASHGGVEGVVGPSDARFYAGCVLDALEHMHDKSIAYRDLKPENLLLDLRGFIKVVDFGFAKIVRDRTYTLCGTPEYLAPELVQGKGHNHGVDYWALGILLYEMVSGYSPFADDEGDGNPVTIYRNVTKSPLRFPEHVTDADLRDVISRLLTRDVHKRLGMLRGGASEVKSHPFFRSIDWDELREGRAKAPWIPPVRDKFDMSNFDTYEEEEPLRPYVDDGRGWDKDF